VAANLGVNPSLTITALSERAMEFIPDRRDNSWNDRAQVS
jgi:cholesterol oxidase